MEIEEKYIKLLDKLVYNKRLNKYGRISSLELSHSFGSYWCFNVFYDKFNSHEMLLYEDITKGEVQFVLLLDSHMEEYASQEDDDIKSAIGDKFSYDMIIRMKDDDWKEHLRQSEKRNTQMLHTDLVPLTEISAEVMSDDFYSRELYLKYKDGILNERQMMYALVNHLCQEYKRLWDQNGRYFFKYEFEKTLEKTMAEMKTRQNQN